MTEHSDSRQIDEEWEKSGCLPPDEVVKLTPSQEEEIIKRNRLAYESGKMNETERKLLAINADTAWRAGYISYDCRCRVLEAINMDDEATR